MRGWGPCGRSSILRSPTVKRLYLTSVKLDKLKELLQGPPDNLRLAFIPTAADTYKNKWFVEEDRKKLKEMGFKMFNLDLKGKNRHELEKELENVQVVYLTGGNSFYLLEKIRESGFDKVIMELVEKGVIFAGASAGAVVAGKDISQARLLDDPTKASNLKSTKGLGFVDFIIFPHYGNQKYEEKYKKIIAECKSKKIKYVTLTDNQAIIIEESNYRTVGSK